ncbi:8-oxo-dGTP diphosphatase [Rathayibacter oskolensis]|uniref:8-oxo-dGTP diphosphatase n=1 Tax=Rathayibacter oskolensis TaxID=1891671 RepID=A0A1X7NC96_9MICO|nr:NUDIX domain-containing protein [Rathayibacter oskolensis]SMH35247.1 8-oxo-dGTP diphosphatase [Rathayibacter oskolensis]
MSGLPEVCVVYVLRESPSGVEVLLGEKRRGLGQGRVVAPGGKLEPGESAERAAVRELAEEVGLIADERDLEPRGRLDYHFPHRPAWSQRSHVFVCRRWSGVVVASSELAADFVPIADVPYSSMWDDARFWLPAVLASGDSARWIFEFGSDLASVVASDAPGWSGGGVQDRG